MSKGLALYVNGSGNYGNNVKHGNYGNDVNHGNYGNDVKHGNYNGNDVKHGNYGNGCNNTNSTITSVYTITALYQTHTRTDILHFTEMCSIFKIVTGNLKQACFML